MDKDNIWVEKYRPKNLTDMVGHTKVIAAIEKKLASKSLQNIILYGPAGTGKTSLARVIANEIYGDGGAQRMLDLNASDENGIDVIRSKVKSRAMSSSIEGKPQILLLDEVEAMTSQAQAALRRIMEDSASNTVFILATNDIDSVILPIQSRCKGSTYELGRLEKDNILQLLSSILVAEGQTEKNMDLEGPVGEGIIKKCDGDARAAVDYIQSWCQGEIIEQTNSKSRFISLMTDLKNSSEPAELLQYIKPEELGDFSHFIIASTNQSATLRMELSEILGETDFRMQRSHNKDIQLVWMLIQFMKALKGE